MAIRPASVMMQSVMAITRVKTNRRALRTATQGEPQQEDRDEPGAESKKVQAPPGDVRAPGTAQIRLRRGHGIDHPDLSVPRALPPGLKLVALARLVVQKLSLLHISE